MKALFVLALLGAGLFLIASNWESLVPPESDTCGTAENLGAGMSGSPMQVDVHCR